MNSLKYNWPFPWSVIALWGICTFFAGIEWLTTSNVIKSLWVFGAMLAILVVVTIHEFYVLPTITTVNFSDLTLTCRYRTIFGIKRDKSFSLKSFDSVQSFLTTGQVNFSIVRVMSPTKSVIVARFKPAYEKEGPLSFPEARESQDAMRLRMSIAEKTGIKDQGFVGYRFFPLL